MVSKIFSKKVTRSEIKSVLNVPTESLRHFCFRRGHNAQDLHVKDRRGNEWRLGLRTRKKGYQKPVISKRWCEFVKDNNLEEGFEVTFFKEDDEVTGEVKYTVEVKKPYIVFGKMLGHVSQSL